MTVTPLCRRLVAALGVATLGLLAASAARADAISVVTKPDNWTFSGPDQVFVSGMSSPAFANSANQRFLVTFTAECAVDAPTGNPNAWLDVDIVLRKSTGAVVATLAPTVGAADAFCSSTGTAGFGHWATHSVTAVGGANLPAGTYNIAVKSRLNNGATGGWLGERSLVVWR